MQVQQRCCKADVTHMEKVLLYNEKERKKTCVFPTDTVTGVCAIMD